jgi:hypothetical protein
MPKSRRSRRRTKSQKREVSRRSRGRLQHRRTRASPDMTLTDLQFMAKSKGIPFGGLTKTKLIMKINKYI